MNNYYVKSEDSEERTLLLLGLVFSILYFTIPLIITSNL